MGGFEIEWKAQLTSLLLLRFEKNDPARYCQQPNTWDFRRGALHGRASRIIGGLMGDG